ncbi:MAG: NUDIX domain-containing protein [Candidatus Promineifilaceae bacterium]|jgi:8-oxo-dGTP pyrophosphatase MutT (NUDIX family)
MDRKSFQATLPTKRISAGMLMFDEQGDLLVVEPTYKDTWEIPGGVVELNESPRQAVIREVAEELGLDCEPKRLLGVDHTAASETRTESVHFIFLGPPLTKKRLDAIRLKRDELHSYRLLPPEEATKLLNKKLRRRVRRCLKVVDKKRTIYMEEQKPR